MKKVWMISALAGAAALALLLPAIAQQRSSGVRGTRAGMFVQFIVRDLNLTPDQRAQIKTIFQRERPAIRAIMQQSQQQETLFRAHGAYDEAYVRSIAQRQSANYVEAIVEKEKIRSQIHEVLTPEQRRRFNQLSTEFRAAVFDRLDNFGDQF
jgi:Spy/CpxP family protein refolding chaperone